jgi:hypothetical protein
VISEVGDAVGKFYEARVLVSVVLRFSPEVRLKEGLKSLLQEAVFRAPVNEAAGDEFDSTDVRGMADETISPPEPKPLIRAGWATISGPKAGP